MQKINNVINYSIILSILFMLLGMVLIVFPSLSITTISYVVSVLLIVSGVAIVVTARDKVFITLALLSGMFQVLLGIIMLRYPNLLRTFIPLVIGMWMIFKSTIDVRVSLILRRFRPNDWFYSLILAILAIACGFFLIISPKIGSLALTMVVGVLLIAYSLTALIDSIIFKQNVNGIAKELGFSKKN